MEGVHFGANFTASQTQSPAVKAEWDHFRAQLGKNMDDGYVFTRVILRGSNDPIGVSCVGPEAQTLASNLANDIDGYVDCNGVNWATRGETSYTGIAWNSTSGGTCANPGYIVRPSIANSNWGGINTATCSTNPTQYMEVLFD
jgi:hypothetical protein